MRKIFLLVRLTAINAFTSFAHSSSFLKDITLAIVLVGSRQGYLTARGSSVYFMANTLSNGAELWKSDGTAAGTAMVAEILPGMGSSAAQFITNLNGTLYFSANDETHGMELWKSDGTMAGTAMVKDINPGAGSANVAYLAN